MEGVEGVEIPKATKAIKKPRSVSATRPRDPITESDEGRSKSTSRVSVKAQGRSKNKEGRINRSITARKKAANVITNEKRKGKPVTTSTADIILFLGEKITLPLENGVYYNTCSKTVHTFENGRFLNREITDDPDCIIKISRKNYPKLNKYISQDQTFESLRALEASPLKEHMFLPCFPGTNYGCPDYTQNFIDFMSSRKYASFNLNPSEEILQSQEINPVEGASPGIEEGSRGVWQMLNSFELERQNMYIVYAFIRNTIDFLHDFLNVGVGQYRNLITAFTRKYTWAVTDPIFNKWVERIPEVITSGNNVNQNTCRSLCEEMIEEYNSKIAIPWLIGNRANALVLTASLANDAELENFIDVLQADDVKGIYIESMMGSALPLYVKAASKGIQYVSIKSGDWDAGSGFSLEKARKSVPGLSEIKIQRAGPFSQSIVQAPSITPDLNTAWSSFGLNSIFLDEATNVMNVRSINGDFSISALAGKPQKLSVNSICSTVGLPKVRGKKGDDETSIDPLVLTRTGIPPIEIMMLKSWTDTIQTVDSIADPIRNKVGIVYSDILAELTGMFEGSKCSILYNDGKLHYYCYDTRARSMPEAIKQLKLRTRMYIINNLQRLSTDYLTKWFESTHRALQFMLDNTNTPSIYLAAMRAITMIQLQQGKINENIQAVLGCSFNDDGTLGSIDHQYKTVITLPKAVDEFLNKITSSEDIIGTFQTIYQTLENIASDLAEEQVTKIEGTEYPALRLTRIDPKEFIDLIYQIKQYTINSIKEVDDIHTIYKLVGAVISQGLSVYPYSSTMDFSNAAVNTAVQGKIHHIRESLKSTIGIIGGTRAIGDYTIEEREEISIILNYAYTIFDLFVGDDNITISKVLDTLSATPAAIESGVSVKAGMNYRKTFKRRKSRRNKTWKNKN